MATDRLRPRDVVYEPTPEQQATDHQRARRRALHLQLHDLLAYADAVQEETYGGKMNLPPEKSESSTGCSLTHSFVSWLETHQPPDVTEARRRRQLCVALDRLRAERPDLLHIVETHARSHTSLTALAGQWRISTKTSTEGFAEGLDLMLAYLET